MKNTIPALLMLMVIQPMFAQPHLSGEVRVDRELGFISCDFALSGLPELSSYRILLNHGMTIKYFKDVHDSLLPYEGYYEGEMKGEALAYVLKSVEGDTLVLPGKMRVAYSGAFPVYRDTYNSFDYKGYIAVNEKTFRATEQSKWYPVIYDVENDRLIDSYTYEISVTHPHAATVFLNGSAPSREDPARIRSEKAVPLFLFAGDYDFMDVDGDFLLNTDIEMEKGKAIFRNTGMIKASLARLMEAEFTDHLYFVNFESVRKFGPNENWGFNMYPAIAYAGLDFGNMLDETGQFWSPILNFLAHEMAHNYFGPNVMSGTYFWFWLESVPEYLSLLVAEELKGRGVVEYELTQMKNAVKDKSFIPLASVRETTDIGQDYRYRLGPLVLKVFEGTFGREKTLAVLQDLRARSATAGLDLLAWREAALRAGIPEAAWRDFSGQYLESPNFATDTIKWIEVNEL